MLFLFSYSYSQHLEVHSYCIDEEPLEANTCDIYGEEYTYIEIDEKNEKISLYYNEELTEFTLVRIDWLEKQGHYRYVIFNKNNIRASLYSLKDKSRFLFEFDGFTMTLKIKE